MTPDLDPAYAAVMLPADGAVIHTYADLVALMRTAREENGLSGTAVAAQMGCAASLVSLRETGQRIIPADDLIKLWGVLGKRMILVDAAPTEITAPIAQ